MIYSDLHCIVFLQSSFCLRSNCANAFVITVNSYIRVCYLTVHMDEIKWYIFSNISEIYKSNMLQINLRRSIIICDKWTYFKSIIWGE